ncbi:MAG: hypothetical protein JO080_09075 [Mucilaginibacter sp.]|nr:hypothetical protein [Mucilaginibacter sp.]
MASTVSDFIIGVIDGSGISVFEKGVMRLEMFQDRIIHGQYVAEKGWRVTLLPELFNIFWIVNIFKQLRHRATS